MKAVKMSLIVSIIILFSGCAECKPQLDRCTTPNVERPIVNNKSCNGEQRCVFEKTMTNYELMVKYADSLLDANRVCK